MKIFLCSTDEYAYKLARKYKLPILISFFNFRNKKWKQFFNIIDLMNGKNKKEGAKNADIDGK